MIFLNHNYLSKVYIAFWHMVTLWFLVLHGKKNGLKTFFLSASKMQDAHYIVIERNRQGTVQGTDLGVMVEYAQRLEHIFRKYTKTNVSREITSVKQAQDDTLYVEYECVRYMYDSKTNSFSPHQFRLGDTNSQILQNSKGLTDREAMTRINFVGPNEILFTMDSFSEALIKEFTGIFYLYQLLTLSIWYFYAYYYMGALLTIIIIGSGFTKVSVALKAQKKVLDMSKYNGHDRVFRNGRWTEVRSNELVTGDLIEIYANGEALSADCAIVSGHVVVDESSLTGEALPVTKFAIKNNDEHFSKELNAKRNCLFAGTTVLETQPNEVGEKITAIVLDTGGSTEKGKLVRDILYPTPFVFVFNEHLKIIVPMLIIWGIVLLILSIMMLQKSDLGSWFYGMFSISQVLSPVLPAVLVIGQSVASERLRKNGIICVDLNRITLAGKVKVFCFDKTGTLTKEGLDFFGVNEVKENGREFDEIKHGFAKFNYPMQLAMQSCHSLAMAQNNCVGNFVDVEMFRATGASLDPNNNTVIYSEQSRGPINVLKRFEFSHHHAYMSSICKDVSTGKSFVLLKGSFERIAEMSDPESLPPNFMMKAKEHAGKGFYVIAIAAKELRMTESEIQSTPREELESKARFVGLMLFRNELKPDSAQALSKLREGGCRAVMITGDNQNTALFIARASGMIQSNEYGKDPHVIMAEYKDSVVEWHDVATNEKLSQSDVERAIHNGRFGDRKVELVIVGQAFNQLVEHYWLPQYLSEVRVFARMKPMDKVKCVRLHMSSHITAMCGDGGNDAGALKAAHAGISLSGAGSSVVAHFSSQDLSLNCCVRLLREARCSLDVSFAAYKMLILYGEILAVGGLIQYYFQVQMSEWMWIFVDGCTVPVSWALTMAKPAKRLSEYRPTARLLGFETILSVIGQMVINIIFSAAMVVILFRQPFFVCNEFDSRFVDLRKWWELADNYEGEVTGMMTAFQIIHAACAFNIGKRYREGFWKNHIFVAVYSTAFFMLSYILLSNPTPLSCLFHINCGTKSALESLGYKVWFDAPRIYHSPLGHNVIPVYFRWTILAMIVLNLFALLIWEGVFITGPIRKIALAYSKRKNWMIQKTPLRP